MTLAEPCSLSTLVEAVHIYQQDVVCPATLAQCRGNSFRVAAGRGSILGRQCLRKFDRIE